MKKYDLSCKDLHEYTKLQIIVDCAGFVGVFILLMVIIWMLGGR